MDTLTYRHPATKNGNHIAEGFIYMHHFGTGWQELVFATHALAEAFAVRNNCELRKD